MNDHSLSTCIGACLRFRAPKLSAARNQIAKSAAAGRRAGFTLIEMMIVILIIVIMTSITIPMLSSASDVRRAREGARVLSTMLASAQTEAQVSGRPAAVWIQRMKSSSGAALNSAAAMDLYLAEVPPPYLGDLLSSTASVQIVSGVPTATFTNSLITTTNPTSSPALNLLLVGVQAGDLVRFEYRGELFYLSNVIYSTTTNTTSATITPLDPSLVGSPQASPPGNLPFQIYRRPIKSLASAVQMSDGVAIDLAWSGADPNPTAVLTNVTTKSVPGFTSWWAQSATSAQYNQSWFNAPFFVPSSTSPPQPPPPSPAATSPADIGAIIITFNSSGALDLVYGLSEVPNSATPPVIAASAVVYRPTSGVYLLVGKVENIPVPVPSTSATPPPTSNMNSPSWNDMNSRWVAIGHTGLVTTAEANYVTQPPSDNSALSSATPVVTSLRLARSSQNAGGN